MPMTWWWFYQHLLPSPEREERREGKVEGREGLYRCWERLGLARKAPMSEDGKVVVRW